jgi:DNA ligase-1
MLADKVTDVASLRFPVLASKKLDGVRCLVQDGILVSRTLKPIPNVNVQAKFKGLPEGTDGELIVGDPRDPEAYRRTVSVVMSDDKPLNFFGSTVTFHVFDQFLADALPFEIRLINICDQIALLGDKLTHDVQMVGHATINNPEELARLEEAWLTEGYEGVMIRDPQGPYKQGRSSEKQGWLLKLKQFEDGEARVVNFVEECENTNTATKNALGRTERSTAKAGMVGKGRLGKFEVVGIGGTYDGVEFSVGGGFTAAMRQEFWQQMPMLKGRILKFKYFASGSKERPRFPVFLGWRDERDM